MSPSFTHPVAVLASDIDANGHVSNVEFVRWMNAASIAHADAVGCSAATRAAGALWVARKIQIEYFKPAFLGDRIEVRTHIANVRRVFSLRKYELVRESDRALLARGETDFVFVDAASGRPRSVPANVIAMFGAAGSEPAE